MNRPACVLWIILLVSTLVQAQAVTFELPDAYGRIVSSQDYEGVPVFLEFGACW